MTGVLRVAACQLPLRTGDPAANARLTGAAIREAAGGGAQVIVLPELANSGYLLSDPAEARSLAEPVGGPTTQAWQALAAELGVIVVGGLCERGPGSDGSAGPDSPVLFNAAIVVGPTGLLGVYRKAHLWGAEPSLFAAGDAPPLIVDTAFGRLAVLICCDLEFPDWTLLAAQADADLLAVPTSWPVVGPDVPVGERPVEWLRAQSAAAGGLFHLAVADVCGTDRGVSWRGASGVIGPHGWAAAGPAGALERAILLADCDTARAAQLRREPSGHLLADRRPELYSTWHPVLIDLSVPLDEGTQVFPGDPEPRLAPATTLAEHGFNVLHVQMGSQTGTHVDAPFHVRADGARLDELPLGRFFGPAVVADVRGRPARSVITRADLEPIWPAARPGVIVLLNTGWDVQMGRPSYFNHPFLGEEAAAALVAAGVRTVGIDAPNLDRTDLAGGPPALPAHQVLAKAGAVIIENLTHLSAVPAGATVSVLPLRLTGADGAPCRAVAIAPPIASVIAPPR